ncbi:MAG: AURKAIP1/COX24 domain-containing protein [Candidatus Mariimomonas ferrooxydans]
MGNVVKWRRKKMSKHKHKKLLKKNRHKKKK